MMEAHVHRKTQKRIERLFTCGLSRASRDVLFREIDGCEGCGKYYRRYHQLESALTGSFAGTSHFAKERVLDAVIGAVTGAEEPQEFTPPVGGRWALLGAVGVVAAALVLIFWLRVPDRFDRVSISESAELAPVETIAVKGYPAREVADVGIRLFKVSGEGNQVAEKNELFLNDIITFTYTFAKPHAGYLALFGIQNNGEVRWYYPDYGQEESVRIEGDKIDEPLKDGIVLSKNHEPGWLRIVALFSDHPVEVSAIEASVSNLEEKSELKSLTPLSDTEYGVHSIQYSVMVKIEGIVGIEGVE